MLKTLTEEHKKKISNSLKGRKLSEQAKKKISNENNYAWKGDDVGYTSLHQWVAKNKGNPTKCEHCGKESNNRRQILWANKSHEYKRELDDWIALCVSCHIKYDGTVGFKKGYTLWNKK